MARIDYTDNQIQGLLQELPFMMECASGWRVYYADENNILQVEYFGCRDKTLEFLWEKQDEAIAREREDLRHFIERNKKRQIV